MAWLFGRRLIGFLELLRRLRALEAPTVRRMPDPADLKQFARFSLGEYRAARAHGQEEKIGPVAVVRHRMQPPWPRAVLHREERRRIRANGITCRGCS